MISRWSAAEVGRGSTMAERKTIHFQRSRHPGVLSYCGGD